MRVCLNVVMLWSPCYERAKLVDQAVLALKSLILTHLLHVPASPRAH
jgi:hypothetical protein